MPIHRCPKCHCTTFVAPVKVIQHSDLTFVPSNLPPEDSCYLESPGEFDVEGFELRAGASSFECCQCGSKGAVPGPTLGELLDEACTGDEPKACVVVPSHTDEGFPDLGLDGSLRLSEKGRARYATVLALPAEAFEGAHGQVIEVFCQSQGVDADLRVQTRTLRELSHLLCGNVPESLYDDCIEGA